METASVFSSIIAGLILATLSNWLYDILKDKGILPAQPTIWRVIIVLLASVPFIILVALPQLLPSWSITITAEQWVLITYGFAYAIITGIGVWLIRELSVRAWFALLSSAIAYGYFSQADSIIDQSILSILTIVLLTTAAIILRRNPGGARAGTFLRNALRQNRNIIINIAAILILLLAAIWFMRQPNTERLVVLLLGLVVFTTLFTLTQSLSRNTFITACGFIAIIVGNWLFGQTTFPTVSSDPENVMQAVGTTTTPTFTITTDNQDSGNFQNPTDTPSPTGTSTPPTPTVASPTPTPTIPLADAIVIANPSLRLRTGPGTAYDTINTYSAGTEVDVEGKSPDGEWLVVQTSDGNTGWMAVSGLQVNVDIGDATVAQVPPTPTARPQPAASPTARPVAVATSAPAAPAGPLNLDGEWYVYNGVRDKEGYVSMDVSGGTVLNISFLYANKDGSTVNCYGRADGVNIPIVNNAVSYSLLTHDGNSTISISIRFTSSSTLSGVVTVAPINPDEMCNYSFQAQYNNRPNLK